MIDVKRLTETVKIGDVEPSWTEIANAVPGLCFIADANGANVFANAAYQAFTGLSAKELSGDGWLAAIPPEDRALRLEGWMRAVRARTIYDNQMRILRRDGAPRWHRWRCSPTFDDRGEVVRWVGIAFDVHESHEAEARRETLISELRHRDKNLLTVVQAIADMTSRSARDPDHFVEAFSGRLASIARVNDAVIQTDWSGLELSRVIAEEIAPYGEEVAARCHPRGAQIGLPPGKGLSVVLVLHELVTNAVKYGALSVPAGHVFVCWKREKGVVKVRWQEFWGPPVVDKPREVGFGRRLIEVVTARDLARPAIYEFKPWGVRCAFAFEAAD
jgi:PAS domain S-box-containing protein